MEYINRTNDPRCEVDATAAIRNLRVASGWVASIGHRGKGDTVTLEVRHRPRVMGPEGKMITLPASSPGGTVYRYAGFKRTDAEDLEVFARAQDGNIGLRLNKWKAGLPYIQVR